MSEKIECSNENCTNLTIPKSIGKCASYFNVKKEVICWNCFQKELGKEDVNQ